LSYFGLKNIDKPSILACIQNFASLHEISAERKKIEFFKLLAGEYAIEVIKILLKENLLEHIGFCKEELPCEILDNKQFLEHDSIVNLAIILKLFSHPHEKLTALKKALKLSNKEHKKLCSLISFSEKEFTDWHHYKYIYKLGVQDYIKFLYIINNSSDLKKYHTYIALAKNYPNIKFPVNGRDLQKLSIHGAMIGSALDKLMKHWHYNNNSLSKKELLNNLK